MTVDNSQRFPIDPHVKQTISDEDIVPDSLLQIQADHAGIEIARSFTAGGKPFALEGEQHAAFRRLAESMQRTAGLRDTISLETILSLLTEWLRKTATGETKETASDFVLSKAQGEVGEYTIVMPLYHVLIQEPFELGKVTIRTLSREDIDRWIGRQIKHDPEHAEAITQAGEKWRTKHQGVAAAWITLTAEPKRAYEVARREAEDGLAMLQVFSIGTIVPGARCYWTLFGSERVEQYAYFALDTNEVKPLLGGSGYYRFRNSTASISSVLLAELKRRGLDIASGLLRMSKRNDFQEKLLEALLIYSRSAIQEEMSEKLLYILVALESFLIRDETEPIQQNLSERIAFTIGRNVVERQAIVKAVRKAYGLRSRFMHHGEEIDDVKAMEEFMAYAYSFFETALHIDSVPTRKGFLDALEARKLT